MKNINKLWMQSLRQCTVFWYFHLNMTLVTGTMLVLACVHMTRIFLFFVEQSHPVRGCTENGERLTFHASPQSLHSLGMLGKAILSG